MYAAIPPVCSVNPEGSAMGAPASGRIPVGITHVTVAFEVHVPEGTFPASEYLFVNCLLFLVFGHPFTDRTGGRRHARFPFCGVAPVVGHAADFIRVGIVYL